jgi:hypothetical protein
MPHSEKKSLTGIQGIKKYCVSCKMVSVRILSASLQVVQLYILGYLEQDQNLCSELNIKILLSQPRLVAKTVGSQAGHKLMQ